MNTELLKKKILQLAMQGKLVEQDESEGTADELIDQILEEKKKLMAEGKIKKEKLSRIYKNPADNHYYEKFEDGQKKDINTENIYLIPDGWNWVHLEDIGYFVSGYTPQKNELVSDGEIPYYKVSDMNTKGNEVYLDKTNNYLNTTKLFFKGTIVYPKNGGALLTNKRRILKYNSVVDLNTGGFCCYDPNCLKYIFLLFNSIDFNYYYKGSALPTLDMDKLKSLIIPLPPIQTQKRIVEKIEELYEKIDDIQDHYCRVGKLKMLFKNKIIDSAIKGELTNQLTTDEPSSKLIGKILDEKHKLMKEGKIKKENLSIIYKDTDNQFYEKFDDGKIVNITEELPFDIPTGWSWSRLRNIGIYKKGPFGSSLTKDMFVPRGSDTIKVYEQKNAINKDYTLGNYYITKQYFEQSMKGFEVKPGDIIVSCAGTIGETYILPFDIENGIINQALMKMKIFNNINVDFFLMYFDQILKKESIKNGKGTAMKNIPPFAVFKEYLIPIPPQKEQERIIEKKINIFNYIKTAE